MLPSDQVGGSFVFQMMVFSRAIMKLLAPEILTKTGFTFNICNRTDLVFSMKRLTR